MAQSNKKSRYQIIAVEGGGVELSLAGDWRMGNPLPALEQITEELMQYSGVNRLVITSSELGEWDSRLVSYIFRIILRLEKNQIKTDTEGLPAGIQTLLQLAKAVPERKGARRIEQRSSFLEKLGNKAIDITCEVKNLLTFTGEAWISFARFLQNKASYRPRDLWLTIEESGPSALPIVTLISLLTGLIFAFVGAIQLRMFGADIFIANLVALGMAREMGAMMTAIILAGRTGAAFAAQLGTMQVNEEIDALKTMGISVMDFLILPRMLALILMMPLLTLYADFMGIVGGMIVGVGLLEISFIEYYQQTKTSISLMDCSVGVIKSVVFGVLVAMTGCISGMRCGRSSSAVGTAATDAVVHGIVSIVVADAILTILFHLLGI